MLHKHELQEHVWLPRENVKGMYNGLCSEFLTAVLQSMTAFWDVTLCHWVSDVWCFKNHCAFTFKDYVVQGEGPVQEVQHTTLYCHAASTGHCSMNCFETCRGKGPTIFKTSRATHIQEDMNPHK